MFRFLFLFIYFISFSLKSLPLDEIFKANDTASLKQHIEKENQRLFLKSLCNKQKENKKPPTACYKLALPADESCLSLKISDLGLEILEEALKSSFLSSICKKHLEKLQKLLLYRRKDFLLPELKNYWTAQKPFF